MLYHCHFTYEFGKRTMLEYKTKPQVMFSCNDLKSYKVVLSIKLVIAFESIETSNGPTVDLEGLREVKENIKMQQFERPRTEPISVIVKIACFF